MLQQFSKGHGKRYNLYANIHENDEKSVNRFNFCHRFYQASFSAVAIQPRAARS